MEGAIRRIYFMLPQIADGHRFAMRMSFLEHEFLSNDTNLPCGWYVFEHE